MKRIKLLLTTLALTAAFATPVFATETTLPAELQLIENRNTEIMNATSTLVSYDNNCGDNAKMAMHGLIDNIRADVKSSQISEDANYINYLKAVLGNAIETERIKKQNVGSLTDLVKVNPSFQPQLDAAIAEYNKAVADHAAAEAAIAQAQEAFMIHAQAMIATSQAKAASDADAIK